ncbi:MAG TPA: SusC/RagA family TonB-linked outer membrane protein, partial [Candidatus Alistipes intestinipullorum]|nr:SusC/RagA family TonB-linked outer membrane protein [Candidatus Alistipes intestinipullorum]
RLLAPTPYAYTIIASTTTITLSKRPEAPSAEVSGVVRDASNRPIIGATVLVAGTTNGVSTDAEGRFALTVPNPETAQLEFSYLGCESQTLQVGSRTRFEITLQESASEIESVVVTALGIKRSEKALAYTVAQVAPEELTTVKDANFINALSGKVAGAVVNASSSGVGGVSKVVMRGMKSIMQSSNTLYVIDGIPMFNNSSKGGMEFDSKGATESIADLNPDDIASMSVMTGAAAAALYGSEAANGAVLITTKRGEAGTLKVTVSTNIEFLQPFWLPEFQNRYGTGRKGKTTGSKIHSWGPYLSENARYGYTPEDFMQTGHVYTNSFTLSGGSERNQTYFSAAAVNSDGLIPNNEYNRYNFTFRNTSHFLDDRLTLDASASYIIQDDRNMTNQGVYSNPLVPAYLFPRGDNFDLIRTFERWDPARKIYAQFWPQGAGDLEMQNPYWIAYRNPRENNRHRYLLSASASYSIFDWLDVSGRIRIDNTDRSFTQKLYATTNSTLLEGSKYGHYTELSEKSRQTYGDVMLNINKTFGELFSLAAHVGASLNDTRLQGLELNGPLQNPSNIFHPEAIDPTKRKVMRSGWHEQTQSLFASLELGWRSQLFLTVTGRNDWASQLAGSPQSSFFYPSAGLSWLPSATFDFPELFPYLKIRASWASVGTPFPRELTYATHPYDHTGQTWDDKTNYPIGELRPERTKTWELGFDARFLNGFDLSFSWYLADTYNQTFNPQVSASSGYADMYVQTGHVRNTGIEASLGYSHTWRDFTWNSNFTVSSNRNEIRELMRDWYNPLSGEVISKDRLEINKLGQVRFLLKEGGSMGDIYSNSDLRRDDKGRIEIDEAGNVYVENNLPDMKLGSVFPKANLAWRNDFRWKGVNLGFLIAARIGGVVYSATQANLDLYGVSEASAAARDAGGALVNGRAMVDPEMWYTTIGAGAGIPQYYTYDATNVRLQELSVGYTLPRKWLKVCDITVSLVGRNLWMMYCKAPFDPESVASTENFYTGMDYFIMPSTRNIGFNVNIKF